MVGRPKITTAPLSEPVSLDLAKQQLQIDAGDTSQDSYIGTVLIPAAREVAEAGTAKAYLFQTIREYYDYFPGHEWGPVEEELMYGYYGYGGVDARGTRGRHHRRYLELSRSPLRKVLQVQYLDLTGATQTLDPAQYVVNNAQDPAQIDRKPEILGGQPWPRALREANAVWVDYVAGYGGNVKVSVAMGAAALTGVSGYSFTADDVGLAISIPGAGAASATLVTEIEAVDGSGNATLADDAGTAVSGVTAFLGAGILAGDTQAMLLLISDWYENRLGVGMTDDRIDLLLNKNRVYYQP